MKISAIPNYRTTNKTSFKGCVVKTKALNKAMERAQISDLHNFRAALKAVNRFKDKVEFSFTELNSKFFIGKKIGGTLEYERLLDLKPQKKIVPPKHDSIEYLTVVDKDANGNFIDENGKIITNINDLFACGMRKKGFRPWWNDRRVCYEAEVDTRISHTKEESIDEAFKDFIDCFFYKYYFRIPKNNKIFNTREELIADINEKLK